MWAEIFPRYGKFILRFSMLWKNNFHGVDVYKRQVFSGPGLAGSLLLPKICTGGFASGAGGCGDAFSAV